MQNFAHTAKPLRGGVGLLFIVTLYYSFKSIYICMDHSFNWT